MEKIIIVVLFCFFLFLTSTNAWWDTGWAKRKNITVSQDGINHTNSPVVANITNITFQNISREGRLVSPSGSEVVFDIIQNGTNWVQIIFPMNISNEDKNFSFYYNNPSASESMMLQDSNVWDTYYNATVLPNNATNAWTAETIGTSKEGIDIEGGQNRYNISNLDGSQLWKRSISISSNLTIEASLKIIVENTTDNAGYLTLQNGARATQVNFNSTRIWDANDIGTGCSVNLTSKYRVIRFYFQEAPGGVYTTKVWVDSISCYEGSSSTVNPNSLVGFLTKDSNIYWDYVTYNSTSVLSPLSVSLGQEELVPAIPQWKNNATSYPTGSLYNSTRNYGFQVEWYSHRSTNGYNFSYFEANFSGSFVNYTTNRTLNVSYFNYTDITAGTYKYRFFANDSDNLWNVTDQWDYVINPVPPYFSSNSTNTTLAGKSVNFSIVISDDVGLSSYIFSTNNTGRWVNSSAINISGTQVTAYNLTTLNATVGALVQWRFYVNDTNNAWNASEIYNISLTAPSSAPSTVGTTTVSGTVPELKITTEKGRVKITHITIVRGETKTISFEAEDLPIKEVSITVENRIFSVSLEIIKLADRPAGMDEPAEQVYSYLKIDRSNVQEEDISKIKIRFSVKKSWIEGNDIDPDTIILNRHTNEWNRLPTIKSDETATEIIYQAETPGFSFFAITGEKMAPPECSICSPCSEWSVCINNRQTRTCYRCGAETNYECQAYTEEQFCEVTPSPPPPTVPLGTSLLAIVGILAVIGFIIFKKKRWGHR